MSYRRIVWGMVGIILYTTAWVYPDADHLLIEQALRISGAEQQLREMPAFFSDQFDKLKPSFSTEIQTQIQNIGTNAYSFEAFYNRTTQLLEIEYRPLYLQKVTSWYEKDLGKRIVASEAFLNTPKGKEEFKAFQARLKTERPPTYRLAMIRKLDTALHASELMLEMHMSVFEEFGKLALQNQKVSTQGGLAFSEQVERMRTSLRPKVTAYTIEALLFVYQDFSNTELVAALNYYESDPGQWFSMILKRAFLTQIRFISSEFASVLIK